MHELSVTQGILNLCLDEANKHGVKKINILNIKVGELTGLVPDYINKYFNTIAKDTIAEEATVNFEIVPVGIKCNECQYEGPLGKSRYTCPNCEGNKYTINKGREFYLDTMEVD